MGDDEFEPILDAMAAAYFDLIPERLWPEIGADLALADQSAPWWAQRPELRDQLRAVAAGLILIPRHPAPAGAAMPEQYRG